MTRDEVLKTEFDESFVRGMQDRMVVSFHKYGPVAEGFPHRVNAVKSLKDRLLLYAAGDEAKGIAPGNTEYLMDAANFAMIEFMYPRHPKAHFQPTDDSGSPGRIVARTGLRDERGNSEIGRNHVSTLTEFR